MVEYLHEAKASRPYPHVLTLGNDKQQASQAFVIVAGQALSQNTLLQAIDVCFKAFYVLDLTCLGIPADRYLWNGRRRVQIGKVPPDEITRMQHSSGSCPSVSVPVDSTGLQRVAAFFAAGLSVGLLRGASAAPETPRTSPPSTQFISLTFHGLFLGCFRDIWEPSLEELVLSQLSFSVFLVLFCSSVCLVFHFLSCFLPFWICTYLWLSCLFSSSVSFVSLSVFVVSCIFCGFLWFWLFCFLLLSSLGFDIKIVLCYTCLHLGPVSETPTLPRNSRLKCVVID